MELHVQEYDGLRYSWDGLGTTAFGQSRSGPIIVDGLGGNSEIQWDQLDGSGSANTGVTPAPWGFPLTLNYTLNGVGGTPVTITTGTGSQSIGTLPDGTDVYAEIVHPTYGVIYSLSYTIGSSGEYFTGQGAWF